MQILIYWLLVFVTRLAYKYIESVQIYTLINSMVGPCAALFL